jgi:hypothetical protein
MNSLSHTIAAQFVLARSPMALVIGGRPSHAAPAHSKTALQMAFGAVADAVTAIPISALHARNK